MYIVFDIGTTSIKAALSPAPGALCAAASRPNPQLHWGTDIISRISAAIDSPAERAALHGCLVATLDDMAACLLGEAGAGGRALDGGCAVGNPAMYAFLLDIDPAPLGAFPSSLPPQPDRRLAAADLGFRRVAAPLFVPAPWRGFVGSDALASIVCLTRAGDRAGDRACDRAGGLDGAAGYPALLIDVGTNVEVILLTAPGRGYLASVAGGPAFEDLSLPGDAARLDFDPAGLALEAGPPDAGPPGADALPFYGSGVVALLAHLRRVGAIEPGGRLARGGVGLDFTYAGCRLRLGQRFVRNFQLSKAAMLAAVRTLLDIPGIAAAELTGLFVTGLFGAELDYDSAVFLGMLPAVPPARYRAQVDMPLLGATWLASEPQAAVAVRDGFKHVALDAHHGFKDHFANCMELRP